jgi:septal ring factor EnvC (AmiA/AmiB activator)
MEEAGGSTGNSRKRADRRLKRLQKKLKEKYGDRDLAQQQLENDLRETRGREEELKKKIRDLHDDLSRSLACNMCQDRSVQAVVLVCGHIYCSDCLKV